MLTEYDIQRAVGCLVAYKMMTGILDQTKHIWKSQYWPPMNILQHYALGNI